MKIRPFAVGAAAATLLALTPAVDAQAAASPKFDDAAYSAAYDAYVVAHPTDITGQAAVAQKYGVTIKSVSIPALGVKGLSPVAAQAKVDTDLKAQPSRIRRLSYEDKYSVSGSVGTVPSTGQTLVQGNWNFSDSFAGGYGPKDVAAIEWTAGCMSVSNTAWSIYDYQGNNYNSLGRIRSASPNAGTTAIEVTDSVSGFKTNYDHGSLRIFGNDTCNVQGSFQYEHNQGTSTTFGVSIGFGALSISYNSGGVSSGQRNSGIF